MILGGAFENNIKYVCVVVNKILCILLHVKQDDYNIPEIGTHELYRSLSVLKFHDVCNYNLLKIIRFAMKDRSKLFEKIYEPHLSLQNYYTRNLCFNLPPVRLDVERNFAIFQSIICFNVALAQLCVPMFNYAFKLNYKMVVLEGYGHLFFIWIIFCIRYVLIVF